MRTVDEEAALILSDPASSEQLRRLATAVVDHECDCDGDEHHASCASQDELTEAESALEDAETRAEGLQRDLEADKRQSAAMRQMLEGASDLLSKSHHTGAIEWRSQYLAWQALQRG